MFIFIIVYFFFRLPERKSYQKERAPAVPGGLLRPAFSLKGKNSLRSNSLPFLTAENCPTLYARRSMPESHAALDSTNVRRISQAQKSVPNAAGPAHKRRGVKRRGDYGISASNASR